LSEIGKEIFGKIKQDEPNIGHGVDKFHKEIMIILEERMKELNDMFPLIKKVAQTIIKKL
jgi:hypothetical protein